MHHPHVLSGTDTLQASRKRSTLSTLHTPRGQLTEELNLQMVAGVYKITRSTQQISTTNPSLPDRGMNFRALRNRGHAPRKSWFGKITALRYFHRLDESRGSCTLVVVEQTTVTVFICSLEIRPRGWGGGYIECQRVVIPLST